MICEHCHSLGRDAQDCPHMKPPMNTNPTAELMADPTYDKNEIESSGVYHIAFIISEMVSDSGSHSWSDLDSAMNSTEVIMSNKQRDRVNQVFKLLRIADGSSRKSFVKQSNTQVQSLNVTCRDALISSLAKYDIPFYTRQRFVSQFSYFEKMKIFHQLCIRRIPIEMFCYRCIVARKAITGNIERFFFVNSDNSKFKEIMQEYSTLCSA